jgi:hypothetical protein
VLALTSFDIGRLGNRTIGKCHDAQWELNDTKNIDFMMYVPDYELILELLEICTPNPDSRWTLGDLTNRDRSPEHLLIPDVASFIECSSAP